MDKPEPYLRKQEVVFNFPIDLPEMGGHLVLPYMLSDRDFNTYWKQVVETEMKDETGDEAPISLMYQNRRHIVRDIKLEGLYSKVVTMQNVKKGDLPQQLKLIITMATQKLINEAQSLPESLRRSTDTTTNPFADFNTETEEE